MSALASEIDQVLQQLDSTTASRLERLVRDALALVKPADGDGAGKVEASLITDSPLGYEFPEHSFGLREGIDPSKLGQLADDL